ncbi:MULTISPECIES: RDD family protein [Methanobacterium]|jgi:uncharacterized RDD family membrane protein YckC|uniref:RDD family protein n=1 Tax=Methanobacterium subterraneum TaxID=59277 RepID=A0A2H4VMP8_9EURY|nr:MULTISPECIES: RDD family protein [Methanobacterium]MBW4257069.1 RDD family protein [Methanobacterium sp. YSL]PKL71309.1 MAG: RDD family protein [Methanobacteriales archaeon HGW-Methanobacteriales-2]AUB54619.1 RDD family protein [Methanobacterium subterraneum]AUB58402.1 RDD family protein [Methanobacterium sp. MZ-A1]AUB59377.1 RDD family protein [Methanobacterium subterraneum]
MQEFWGERLAALIVDAIFITLLMWVVTAILYPLIAWVNLYSILNYWVILWGVLILLYFTVMEGKWSTTLGKGLFKLKVHAVDGTMNYKKAFLRNISKFLWIPLVVDIAIGFSRGETGTRKRYLDQFAGTTVVKAE